jgi:hypothetical protein
MNPDVKSPLARVLIGSAIGAAIGFVLLYVSASAAFGDHQNFVLAQKLFPFALTAEPTVLDSPWLVLGLAFLQYPLYGGVVGLALARHRHRAAVVIVTIVFILAAHLVAVRLAHEAYVNLPIIIFYDHSLAVQHRNRTKPCS